MSAGCSQPPKNDLSDVAEPPQLPEPWIVGDGIRSNDVVRFCVRDIRVVTIEREHCRRVTASRVDAPDAGAANRIIPVGVSLLVELSSFFGPQRSTKLHQHFAGHGRVAVHDLRRGVGALLHRGRLHDQARNGEQTESRQPHDHAKRPLHATPFDKQVAIRAPVGP